MLRRTKSCLASVFMATQIITRFRLSRNWHCQAADRCASQQCSMVMQEPMITSSASKLHTNKRQPQGTQERGLLVNGWQTDKRIVAIASISVYPLSIR